MDLGSPLLSVWIWYRFSWYWVVRVWYVCLLERSGTDFHVPFVSLTPCLIRWGSWSVEVGWGREDGGVGLGCGFTSARGGVRRHPPMRVGLGRCRLSPLWGIGPIGGTCELLLPLRLRVSIVANHKSSSMPYPIS